MKTGSLTVGTINKWHAVLMEEGRRRKLLSAHDRDMMRIHSVSGELRAMMRAMRVDQAVMIKSQ